MKTIEVIVYVTHVVMRFYIAGHGAMECACCNMVERGESVIVGVNGIWGERFADMVERHEGIAHKLVKPYGQTYSLKEIEEVSSELCVKYCYDLIHMF